MFADNDRRRLERTLEIEKMSVRIIEADVARFDFTVLAPIAFCILDVDLYLPIRRALPRIYEALAPGGMIAVHDCVPGRIWDGAHQAYMEFMAERGITPEISENAFGVVRNPQT